MKDEPAFSMFVGVCVGMLVIIMIFVIGVFGQAMVVDDCNNFGMFTHNGQQFSCTLIEDEILKG